MLLEWGWNNSSIPIFRDLPLRLRHNVDMRPSNAPKLKLGDTLDGIVVKATGGRRFLLKCKAAPHGWKVELHSRSPEGIEPGSNVHVWVGKINPLKTSLLTYDGDYGRLPISTERLSLLSTLMAKFRVMNLLIFDPCSREFLIKIRPTG